MPKDMYAVPMYVSTNEMGPERLLIDFIPSVTRSHKVTEATDVNVAPGHLYHYHLRRMAPRNGTKANIVPCARSSEVVPSPSIALPDSISLRLV